MRVSTLVLAAMLATAGVPAAAHDTWFQPLPVTATEARLLALGTGNRYPVQETGVGAEYLERQGCRDADGAERVMTPLRDAAHALILRADAAARSCWAQLVPLQITLTPALVAVYLREVQAPREVQDAWARQEAAGLPWRERYVKHARIDLADSSAPQPAAMAMDILREVGADGIQRFTVLREGRPLAGQAMELINERSGLGIWRRADAAGRIVMPALPAGRWIMRGTLLAPVAEEPGHWDSHFVTLAFEIKPAPR